MPQFKFNHSPREEDIVTTHSTRKSSANAEKMLVMRRIEAIRELKEMGFTLKEIQQQLAQE